MTRPAAVLSVAALCLATFGPPVPATGGPAGTRSIGPPEIAQAVAIGFDRGGDGRVQAFHERYRLRLGGPIAQSVEVVTEFRRVVLLAEERLRRGDAGWDAGSAASALAPYRGRLDLTLQLRFPPLNTYRSLPAADVRIFSRGEVRPFELEPLHVEATPSNFGGPVQLAGTPILGARVEASFPASAVGTDRAFLVGVFIDGREVQRFPLDLSRLR